MPREKFVWAALIFHLLIILISKNTIDIKLKKSKCRYQMRNVIDTAVKCYGYVRMTSMNIHLKFLVNVTNVKVATS